MPDAQPPPAPPAWVESRPEPAAPLRAATTTGRLQVGPNQAPAELVVECRAGSPISANLRLGGETGFDLSPYEGPDAWGETHKLLTVALDGRAAPPRNVSGWWTTSERFNLSFRLDAAEARAWKAAAGRPLRIALPPAASGKPSPVLEAEFRLPADDRVLAAVIAPCLARP